MRSAQDVPGTETGVSPGLRGRERSCGPGVGVMGLLSSQQQGKTVPRGGTLGVPSAVGPRPLCVCEDGSTEGGPASPGRGSKHPCSPRKHPHQITPGADSPEPVLSHHPQQSRGKFQKAASALCGPLGPGGSRRCLEVQGLLEEHICVRDAGRNGGPVALSGEGKWNI